MEGRAAARAAMLAALALSGCTKTTSLDGVIVDGRGPSDGLQKPLPGATTSVTCPAGAGQLEPVSSDATGHVKFVLGSRFARACVLAVSMPGYEPARVVLGDVCPPHEDQPSEPYCGIETVIVVRLAPAAPTPATTQTQ
jgi:hypothetical protein